MTDLRRARNERINEAKTVENGAAGLRLSFTSAFLKRRCVVTQRAYLSIPVVVQQGVFVALLTGVVLRRECMRIRYVPGSLRWFPAVGAQPDCSNLTA